MLQNHLYKRDLSLREDFGCRDEIYPISPKALKYHYDHPHWQLTGSQFFIVPFKVCWQRLIHSLVPLKTIWLPPPHTQILSYALGRTGTTVLFLFLSFFFS